MKKKLAILAVALLLAFDTVPVFAHHGWTYFDTSRIYYLEGHIVSVRWGNPHPEIVLRPIAVSSVPDLSRVKMPQAENGLLRTMPALPVPANIQAMPTDGAEYVIVLAPPSRLADWGMTESDTLSGRRLRMVGYLACDDSHEFRPEVVILDDNRAVRQRSVPVPPTSCS